MIEEIMRWITKESRGLTYGELVITIKFHDGRVSVVEKTKTERTKLEGASAW